MNGSVKHIIHVNIVVRDLARSLDFYTDLLGAQVVREWTDATDTAAIALGFRRDGFVGKARYKAALIRWGDGDEMTFPQIDLLEWVEPQSEGEASSRLNNIGIVRIAVEVDDIDAMHSRLLDAGVEFLSEPVPINPETERGRKVKAVCLLDPDGVVIELVGRGVEWTPRPSADS